jgi:hypothetical protein
MNIIKNDCQEKDYFLQRIEALGLDETEAKKHGIFPDEKGNILQQVKTFDGEPRQYIPKRDFERLQQAQKLRSTFSPLHRLQIHFVKRFHPDTLRKYPNLPKYLNPKGQPAFPIPTRTAIANFKNGTTGGTVIFTEGYFKCVAMDLQGLESFAFTGITHYQIKNDVREYLLQRKPERLVMLYDADALLIKEPKKDHYHSSRRPEDFCNSATRFAAQFFDLRDEHSLPTQLYFAMVDPGSDHKGVDDLLEAAEDPRDIAEQLEGKNDAQDIIRFKLSPSTYAKKLRKFFGLDSYRNFYENHAEQIEQQPFKYKGNLYQVTNQTHFNGQPVFRLLSDPYKTNIHAQQLTINKYLGECAAELDAILEQSEKVAVQAPTGAGKTTFFAQLAKRKGKQLVIACPTVNLAKQQAKKTRGAVAITGSRNYVKINKAAAAQLVFCTYDTLHHIGDLFRRILVIDEAHNLTNQHNFRAETLRKVLALSAEAQQVVLLSGTMPPLLCQALDFHLVNVHRRHSNQVRTFVVESEGTQAQKLTGTLLTQLKQIDFQSDKIHFAFFNNTEQVEAIRQHLIEAGTLTAEQIAVITRTHADAGEDEALQDIIQRSKVSKGLKLVLTTCLISEGVNIENKNIGRVYMVNPRCPDLFRQFVARFRNVHRLPVFLVLPKEKDLGHSFTGLTVEDLLQLKQGEAQAQQPVAAKFIERHRSELGEDVLPFVDSIERSSYSYQSKEFPFIYLDEDKQPQIDQLKILAEIREQCLQDANNAYFLQQITAQPNITLYSIEQKETDEQTAEQLKARQEAQDAAKADILQQLKTDLIQQPQTAVKALHVLYDRTGNRKERGKLEKFAEDLLHNADQDAAEAYLEAHKEDFSRKWYRKLIRDFCRMVFAGIKPQQLEAILQDYSEGKFKNEWQQLKAIAAQLVYEKRSTRAKLQSIHAAELHLRKLQANSIEKAATATGGKLTAEQLQEAVQKPLQRRNYKNSLEGELEKINHVTPQKAVQTAKEIFHVIEHKKHTGTVYEIGERWTDISPENLQKMYAGKMQFLHTIAEAFLLEPLKILRVYELEG